MNYDEEADVLYISFGPPRKGIGIEISEGDVVRIDPFTDKVVGMTIIDFKYKYWGRPGNSLREKATAVLPDILKGFEERRNALHI